MKESVFNALPVLAPSAALLPPSAWGLTIGDNFLFDEDSHQQPVSLVPDANRVTYCRRITQDRTGGPFPMSSNLQENFTRVAQPVSAGGPFPPSGAGYTEIYYPADGVIKGQGSAGFVRIYDVIEEG